MPPTERDIDTLARTIWGEARNQGCGGMIAVAWWGEGYAGVYLRN